MQCLPQPFDLVDPRVIDRLEHQLKFRVPPQERIGLSTPVGVDVVQDQNDSSLPAIGATQLLQQLYEQIGVLSGCLDPYDFAGMCMQGTRQVPLLVLTWRRDELLDTNCTPAGADLGVEVYVGLVDVEHGSVWISVFKNPLDLVKLRCFAGICPVEEWPSSPVDVADDWQQPANRRGVDGAAESLADLDGEQLGRPACTKITKFFRGTGQEHMEQLYNLRRDRRRPPAMWQ